MDARPTQPAWLVALRGWFVRIAWRQLVAFALVALAYALVSFFALDVIHDHLGGVNTRVAFAVHLHPTRATDVLALVLTRMGGPTGTRIVGAVVAAVLLRARRFDDAYTLLAGIVGCSGFATLMKGAFHEPRPHLYASIAPEHGYGYPSGHAIFATFLYGSILLALRPWFRERPARAVMIVPLLPVPVAIMWSRLYLGVHWLTDVAGGVICGLLWLSATVVVRQRAERT